MSQLLRPGFASGRYQPCRPLRVPPPALSGLRPPTPSGNRPPTPSGICPPRTSGLRPPASSFVHAPSSSGLRAPTGSGIRPPTPSGICLPRTSGLRPPGFSFVHTPSPSGLRAPIQSGIRPPRTRTSSCPGEQLRDATPPVGYSTLRRAADDSVCTPRASDIPLRRDSHMPLVLRKPFPRYTAIPSPSPISTYSQKSTSPSPTRQIIHPQSPLQSQAISTPRSPICPTPPVVSPTTLSRRSQISPGMRSVRSPSISSSPQTRNPMRSPIPMRSPCPFSPRLETDRTEAVIPVDTAYYPTYYDTRQIDPTFHRRMGVLVPFTPGTQSDGSYEDSFLAYDDPCLSGQPLDFLDITQRQDPEIFRLFDPLSAPDVSGWLTSPVSSPQKIYSPPPITGPPEGMVRYVPVSPGSLSMQADPQYYFSEKDLQREQPLDQTYWAPPVQQEEVISGYGRAPCLQEPSLPEQICYTDPSYNEQRINPEETSAIMDELNRQQWEAARNQLLTQNIPSEMRRQIVPGGYVCPSRTVPEGYYRGMLKDYPFIEASATYPVLKDIARSAFEAGDIESALEYQKKAWKADPRMRRKRPVMSPPQRMETCAQYRSRHYNIPFPTSDPMLKPGRILRETGSISEGICERRITFAEVDQVREISPRGRRYPLSVIADRESLDQGYIVESGVCREETQDGLVVYDDSEGAGIYSDAYQDECDDSGRAWPDTLTPGTPTFDVHRFLSMTPQEQYEWFEKHGTEPLPAELFDTNIIFADILGGQGLNDECCVVDDSFDLSSFLDDTFSDEEDMCQEWAACDISEDILDVDTLLDDENPDEWLCSPEDAMQSPSWPYETGVASSAEWTPFCDD